MKQGSILKVLTGILIGACGTVLAVVLMGVPSWTLWDKLISPEPMDVPVAVSTRLNFDDTGVYTGEIRRALKKSNINFRTIERVFPTREVVTLSTERTQKVRKQAERILNNHGGDVLIYGAVGANPNTIYIRFYAREPGGYIDSGIEVDLNDKEWTNMVVLGVESLATESSLEQYFGLRGIRDGMDLDEFLDVSERKLTRIRQNTESEFLQERTELGIEIVRISRAKTRNDFETIRNIRSSIEAQIGKEFLADEPHYRKVRRLSVADLYIVEGLMEGNSEKIEEGLRLSIEAGASLVEEAMKGDDSSVQAPESASFPHWLMMSILVLACGDEEAMKKFEFLLLEQCGDAKKQCMADSDAARIHIPLAILNTNPELPSLRALSSTLGRFRDFGMGMPDHWQDPFLHARRLADTRVALLQELGKSAQSSWKTKCPHLIPWMEMKGWKR